ncbi:non-ribosomal peptide synthetase [Hyunsoonleella pacifica]|uniref:Amino acid adenylation domain-containing protein n=1 Tax=Hyunsoonleella pacifica TaxID=1080224 RepID=A0A4Q9FU71_9FLAO|nr:amino acid adenylation domain-containing protein [Hyunsoonleella pacifica]TBN18849.1 amino acid adenylation domain-containing protein [Hyunsoonleella pacifica]GGD05315.1 hypothetical protein GCM10011368_03870 [Hyunsoonleella pacifica]
MNKEEKKISLLDKWKNRDSNTILQNTIQKAPIGVNLPLSHGQKRLWFLQQLYPKNPFYNYSETYTLKGKLSENSLIGSLKHIYLNNDVLRTTYHIENGEVFQKINNDNELNILVFDLTKKSSKLKKQEINDIIEKDAKQYFDLTKSPLIRCTLIKKSETESVLIITMHHIVIDEWSMKIFRKQLSKYYNLLNINGEIRDIDDETNKLQYTDYAYWQSKNSINKDHLFYWKNKLSGEIPSLDLPTDFSRPANLNFKGSFSKTVIFENDVSNKIIALSQELSTTPYVILLSAYFTLLHWYSGQNDILVGSPVTNRDQKSLENIIGFFIDTLVIRTEVNPSISFKEFVEVVRKNTLEAFSNKNIPFDLLVKELNIDRSLSTNPFFQVMFVYNEEVETLHFNDNLELTHEYFDTKVAKFDLTFFVTKHNDTFSSKFEFSTELFNESTINSFQEHFNILLKGLINSPNLKLSKAPILTDSEKALYTQENINSYNFEAINGIHSLIETNALKQPNKIAISFNKSSMSYKELNNKSNQIALEILSITEGKNIIIALCIERSIDMIVGMLGILKAGCCYLPIDPEYPKERVDFMLKDSEAQIIVTTNEYSQNFVSEQFSIINIKNIDSPIAEIADIKLPKVLNHQLAYIIYTSGSTGKPKGVAITHKNIINSTLGRFEFYSDAPEVFLLMSSISFDSSKAGIFWTLCKGGNLIITEKRIEQDIEKLGNIINAYKVTHTLMLPSLYSLLINYADYDKIKSLSTVIVAGEVCPPELCKIHFNTFSNINLYNEYGPTEASVWCIAHKVTEEDLSTEKIPIGKPVANTGIYILNEDLKYLPQGAVGEIYIGGTSLSNGYINRKELTEVSFIKNPNKPEERLYKTGDLARYDSNGNIVFLGRVDQQIKIRGYRVELSEIENAIKQFSSDITKSIVLFEEDDSDSELINDTVLNDDETFFKLLKSLNDEELKEIFTK